MKNIIRVSLFSLAVFGSGCSGHKVDEIKQAAPKVWADAGFEVVGYLGYELGGLGPTWGGSVWYIVRRKGNNATVYNGCIAKWGNEYHIYNLKAIDAIKP